MKELVLYVLYYDLFYYFAHKLLHTKLLYPIHKIHHKKQVTEYYDFYAVHIIEVPFTSVGLFVAIYLHKLYIYQLLSAILFINIRGIMSHDHRCIPYTGDHHLIHHKYYKCNYGEYWLDYVFGTLHIKE
jgi:sterol desaturase/sphingolipid hydroxylase (fatty acid hydroxylase superfamily)